MPTSGQSLHLCVLRCSRVTRGQSTNRAARPQRKKLHRFRRPSVLERRAALLNARDRVRAARVDARVPRRDDHQVHDGAVVVQQRRRDGVLERRAALLASPPGAALAYPRAHPVERGLEGARLRLHGPSGAVGDEVLLAEELHHARRALQIAERRLRRAHEDALLGRADEALAADGFERLRALRAARGRGPLPLAHPHGHPQGTKVARLPGSCRSRMLLWLMTLVSRVALAATFALLATLAPACTTHSDAPPAPACV